MNLIHGHYAIANEDFLYVLSTFIYEPIRWNERFGWRSFSTTEKQAIFYFWQAVGEKMNIREIPATYEEFALFNQNYEQKYFIYSDSNRRVGESTINLFLSWFPAFSHTFLRRCVMGLFDDQTLSAFGFTQPSRLIRNLVQNSLRLHGYITKMLLPRIHPDFYTDSKLISYPQGYDLADLGPVKMLSTLNNFPEKQK